MKRSKQIPLIRNFWIPTEEFPDTTLYQNQLGWTDEQKVQSGGYTDTEDVWNHLIAYDSDKVVGWDLCFFYVPNQTFYYIDQMAKVLYILPENDDANEPLYGRVDMRPQIVPEKDELMDFEQASEIWNDFKIGGKDMKYILEHSVLTLCT